MPSSWMGVVGFFSVGCWLFGCSKSCFIEPRYAEYSLDPRRHPESVACFHGCELSASEEQRPACFTACQGVVAWETGEPWTYTNWQPRTWQQRGLR